ncbi:hypothetical protein [Xanthomarina sp. F2636L]|uniref:hypothetical protein n=1 Tax=Xanthomarina sp. F2636L TaxID=2996018 RepID=UPI00225DF58C|nr:hypothetical protein [Xanthomarina sp. F2636L]MCX7549807.1 hypothetical protein [Xanthomarina sp. F2636L]
MKVINSPIKHLIEDTIHLKTGDFYFFKDFIIAEFKEGSHISFNEFEEVMELGKKKYKLENDKLNSVPIGFISNRIHSYSVDLIDMFKNSKFTNQLSAYAIVSYSEVTRKFLSLEDQYFVIPRQKFNNLLEAVDWVESEIKIKTAMYNK